MLNRSTRDLESATARVRFFQGRAIDSIAAEMPILPVTAPAIPVPGPSFVLNGIANGDQPLFTPTPTKGKKKKVTNRPDGVYLTALVRSVLYQTGQVINVDVNGQQESKLFLPGLWACGGRDLYGPQQCRIMVIGKCLGFTEEKTGRPFCGQGSAPLWDAWNEAGIPLPSPDFPVFLTNLVRFVPPISMTKLPGDWIKDGMHLLHQEFALCRPDVVLVLGADALKAIFGTKAKIDDYRGRSVPWTVDCRPEDGAPADLHTAQVVATDHPARVSRDTDLYPGMLAGLRYTAKLLGFGPTVVNKASLDHQAVYTIAELKAAVEETEAASACGGYVSFDCEWEGHHPSDEDFYPYTVQWSHAPGHARVVFLRRCGGAPNTALPMDQALPLLKRVFEKAPARGAKLVAHFGKADLPVLLSLGVDLYPHFVGPDDDPDPDGVERLFDYQKCYFEGGHDTYVGAHAVAETERLKLEIIVAAQLGVDRYDTDVLAWKTNYCKVNKIKQSQLKGYGNIPEHIILPYAAHDCDVTGRLYLHQNGDPRTGAKGILDRDRFGNSSRQIFATRMRAWAAWAEMERYGLGVDLKTHARLRELIMTKRDELTEELRTAANWQETDTHKAFDPGNRRHRVEFLFGETYLDCKSQRPPGALSLYLKPYMATSKYKDRLWDDAVFVQQRNGEEPPSPAANQESLIHLSREHNLASLLKDIDSLGTAMKILLRKPDEVIEAEDEFHADDEDHVVKSSVEVHSKGLIAAICGDGRARSVFGLVETGRPSSGGGLNLMNISGSKDEQFDRMFGWGEACKDKTHPNASKKFTSRAVFCAHPGWFLVDMDLKGAEIMTAAWWSGDPTLADHARRNNLSKTDPDWLDLHADLAREAFHLNMTLAEVKKQKGALRTAAKRARFGHYYGASPETILRQVLEEDPNVTLDQVRQIVIGHDKMYPLLAGFFAACRARVDKPGWLRNGFGGMRRFRKSGERDLLAGQEREAQNWSCQGLVADAVSKGLGNLWKEMRKRKMRSRILLSVYDSIVTECPPEETEMMVDELLPLCICKQVEVYPTDLSGNRLARGPYHFGIDVKVCRNWDVQVPEEEWRETAAFARKKLKPTLAKVGTIE